MPRSPAPLLDIAFTGEAIAWRGPAPYIFVAIPPEQVDAVRDAARRASYGWGVVPVEARIRAVDFRTSLFPRDGAYLLPLKVAVRRQAGISLGDIVGIGMRVVMPVH